MPKEQKVQNLVEALDNLAYVIDTTKPNNCYKIMVDILLSLKEENHYHRECLNNIHHELKILNKTIIMSALLISATKNPEKTLNEYQKIINQYLD